MTAGGLRQRTARGVFWSAVQRWGTSLVNVANFAVLARLLGPETYGLVALASVVIAFCSVFIDEGFSTAIIQREDLEPEHLDSAFWASVGLGVLLTAAMIAVAHPVAAWLHEPGLRSILPWLAAGLLISSLGSVQDAILRRALNFRGLAVRSMIAVLGGAAVAQPLAFFGYGVWSLVAAQLVSSVLGTLTLWRASSWRPRLRFSAPHFRDLFGFGSRMTGNSFLSFVEKRVGDFLIGSVLGSAALGLYSMALKIVLMLLDIMTSVASQVFVPAFSRVQSHPARLRSALQEVTELAALIALPSFAGLALLAPDVIKLLLGDEWAASAPVLQALCGFGIIFAIGFPTHGILVAVGRADWILRLGFFATAMSVGMLSVAVHWGVTAVAIATVCRLLVTSPIRVALACRLIGMDARTYLRCFPAPLGGTCLLVITVGALGAAVRGRLPVAVLLPIEVLTGVAVYTVATLWLAPNQWRRALDFARLAIPGMRGS